MLSRWFGSLRVANETAERAWAPRQHVIPSDIGNCWHRGTCRKRRLTRLRATEEPNIEDAELLVPPKVTDMKVPNARRKKKTMEAIEQLEDPSEKARRLRISQANTGNVPWNKGRKHSPETIEKIRAATQRAMEDPEVKARIKQNKPAQRHTNESKAKISAKNKEAHEKKDPQRREEYRKRMSEIMKKRWEDPEYRQKTIQHLNSPEAAAKRKSTRKAQAKAASTSATPGDEGAQQKKSKRTKAEQPKKVKEASAKKTPGAKKRERETSLIAAEQQYQKLTSTLRDINRTQSTIERAGALLKSLMVKADQLANDPQAYAAAQASMSRCRLAIQNAHIQLRLLNSQLPSGVDISELTSTLEGNQVGEDDQQAKDPKPSHEVSSDDVTGINGQEPRDVDELGAGRSSLRGPLERVAKAMTVVEVPLAWPPPSPNGDKLYKMNGRWSGASNGTPKIPLGLEEDLDNDGLNGRMQSWR